MKKKVKKLQLSRETLQVLTNSDAQNQKVLGGVEVEVISCPSVRPTGTEDPEPCAC